MGAKRENVRDQKSKPGNLARERTDQRGWATRIHAAIANFRNVCQIVSATRNALHVYVLRCRTCVAHTFANEITLKPKSPNDKFIAQNEKHKKTL